MKLFRTLAYFLSDLKVRRSLWALVKFIAFIVVMVVAFSIGFQMLMLRLEGQHYSMLTSIYWTLTTMTTLGYGDIVFASEAGQLYALLVLLGGILTIFIVLPFTFIRFFYAPWLEAQIRRRTPRQVPDGMEGHVILCAYNPLAAGFIELLQQEQIPHFVIEVDPDQASEEYFAGVSVVMGAVDDRQTYEAMQVGRARMVFANLTDEANTNITLTVREVDADVPVVAIARQEHAVEVLRRAGATHVLPLNRWLGEQLANRVNASRAHVHVIGQYRDLVVAELPVHHTPLAGKTVRETQLRRHTGVSIIGVWERGRLEPALPDMPLTEASVPVVVGTESQLDELDYLFAIYDVNPNPVVVIGGGDVGHAATRALREREIKVHLVERDPAVGKRLRGTCDRLVLGDAMDPAILEEAGLSKAPSVIITTTDDALNIFVTAQCRRLNPDLRIISRITLERNIEAIHHAGADFVLGSASLGIETAFSLLMGKELIVLGEGVDLFSMPLPAELEGYTLAGSEIGARTALSVIAIQWDGKLITNPSATTILEPGMELVMFGSGAQRQRFLNEFGEA